MLFDKITAKNDSYLVDFLHNTKMTLIKDWMMQVKKKLLDIVREKIQVKHIMPLKSKTAIQ